ncbi:hypothetical protein TNCV_845751 [Trichonephila clavipes]|nr:hypothetical protein TNCV_845751 [Trichonephila clavipes]
MARKPSGQGPYSWLECQELDLSAAEGSPCKRGSIKSVEAQTSYHWCDVEDRREWYHSSGVVLVSSSFLRLLVTILRKPSWRYVYLRR